MKSILGLIAVALGGLALVVVGGGLLVLLAYGVGWLLTRLLSFTPFEATLLSLIGLSLAWWGIWRVLSAFVSLPSPLGAEDNDDFEEEDFEDEEWEDEALALNEDEADDSPSAGSNAYPGIPLWRQPRKMIDFSAAKPDDRCPCGSGRKYKNCHGRKAKA
jgi:hypothetical protein